MKSKWKVPALLQDTLDKTTYTRAAVVTPRLVDKPILVHNGNSFLKVTPSSEHIGHKLGEFAGTKISSVYKQSKKKGR